MTGSGFLVPESHVGQTEILCHAKMTLRQWSVHVALVCGECFDMTAILTEVLGFICIAAFYIGIIIAAANLLAG